MLDHLGGLVAQRLAVPVVQILNVGEVLKYSDSEFQDLAVDFHFWHVCWGFISRFLTNKQEVRNATAAPIDGRL